MNEMKKILDPLRPDKYLRYLGLLNLFGTRRTGEILNVNPTIIPVREEAATVKIYVYDYDANMLDEKQLNGVEECFDYKENNRISWINIDGIRKSDVDAVSTHFDIHPLIAEDILSINQRPKMDEVEGILFCLLNMLYYNKEKQIVEQEQISIVLGKDFVITFQEDVSRDVFDSLRQKLRLPNSKTRQRSADYLLYNILDMIVDHYFLVMEKLGEQVELLEEEIVRRSNSRSLARINQFRKELIVLRRNIGPVRELVNGVVRSESDLLEEQHEKYFKDVYDHILQANDLADNYRDMIMSMQDIYLGNVNQRTNEVMKVMAIVTCLLAPATVIGGIFGMNFDIIPYRHYTWGFYLAVGAMLLVPLWMLRLFRKRGWF